MVNSRAFVLPAREASATDWFYRRRGRRRRSAWWDPRAAPCPVYDRSTWADAGSHGLSHAVMSVLW